MPRADAAHVSPAAPAVAAGNLDITTIAADRTRITLRLRGEMDLSNANLLTAVLTNQLEHGRRFVRLDLSELDFLDCFGLQVIIEAHNQCIAAHGTLILIGPSSRVARMLTITNLDQALLVADAQVGTHTRSDGVDLTAVPNQ